MVLRVTPTLTRFPTNSLYTPMDNTPLHYISSMRHRSLLCTAEYTPLLFPSQLAFLVSFLWTQACQLSLVHVYRGQQIYFVIIPLEQLASLKSDLFRQAAVVLLIAGQWSYQCLGGKITLLCCCCFPRIRSTGSCEDVNKNTRKLCRLNISRHFKWKRGLIQKKKIQNIFHVMGHISMQSGDIDFFVISNIPL